MRILIFNWKDSKHPAAGGAEVFTHEVAKRWVEWGHEVTLFCAAFPGASEYDETDGVRIVRRGGRFTVYREAPRFWRKEGRGRFDVVIDEINTRPFMTPKYVREVPIVCLIHQLAAQVWYEEVRGPLGFFGKLIEPRWLRRYTFIPTITVSKSTGDDLFSLRFSDVTVISGGIPWKPLDVPGPKEATPTLLYVGRLVRTKRPDHALQAFDLIRRSITDAQLWVVGDGYMRGQLESLGTPAVTFFGYLDQDHKHQLMERAHVLLVPGVREGWGLVVTEANSSGTPAVGYQVPGLRDSIRSGDTGVLVPPSPLDMALAATGLLLSPGDLAEMSAQALNWSRQFSWDDTANRFLAQLGKCCGSDKAYR